MLMKKILSLILMAALFLGCEKDRYPGADDFRPDKDKTEQTPEDNNDGGSTEDPENPTDPDQPEDPETPGTSGWDYSPVTTATFDHNGLTYMWDESVIPEITISVSVDEWNRLLKLFDQNNNTKEYIYCDITYKKGSETHKVEDAGIRLRGNTSRRRPEVGSETHRTNNADWQHCHFGVNLRKFE